MIAEVEVPITMPDDIVAARYAARTMAQSLGFGLADQTRLATAISELVRNVIQYAGTGVCTVSDASDASVVRIRAVIEDHGPGIRDISKAMEDGFSTSGRHGLGLPAARRLVHGFEITSKTGYTAVTIEMVRQRI